MKLHNLILATALSTGLGVTFAFAGVTNTAAAELSPAAVQQAIQQRVDAFFAAQRNAPYGTYQFTDQQLYAALRKNPGKYVLIDIRTPSTWNGIPGYRQGHVAGAVNIPYLQIPAALREHRIPTGKVVVTMCPTGQLSNQTAGVLRLLGYQAYALRGGVNGWRQAHYPLVTGAAPGAFH